MFRGSCNYTLTSLLNATPTSWKKRRWPSLPLSSLSNRSIPWHTSDTHTDSATPRTLTKEDRLTSDITTVGKPMVRVVVIFRLSKTTSILLSRDRCLPSMRTSCRRVRLGMEREERMLAIMRKRASCMMLSCRALHTYIFGPLPGARISWGFW